VDFDGDGINDIISGSYGPGNLSLFKGKTDGTFAPAQTISNATDKPVNVGYASAVFAADFGGKGVLDLVIGNIDGKLFLVQNNGTRERPAFELPRAILVNGERAAMTLKVDGDAGPTVADWDGDGKLDLIVGDNSGAVRFYRNISSGRTPAFDPPKMLIFAGSPGNTNGIGMRTKPCVADFNGDGKLDLLVGDFSSRQVAADPEQLAAAQKELDRLNSEYREASKQLSRAVHDNAPPEQREQLRAKVIALKEQLNQSSMQRAMAEHRFENHGYVWLITRK